MQVGDYTVGRIAILRIAISGDACRHGRLQGGTRGCPCTPLDFDIKGFLRYNTIAKT
jgi:hypothetical protein